MQVHHDEGVANRIDPEFTRRYPCIGEALTGERIGQPLSRESTLILGADVVPLTEGNTDGRDNARPRRPGVVLDTGMCARSLLGNREISWSASATCVRHWSVSGRRGAVADDVRSEANGLNRMNKTTAAQVLSAFLTTADAWLKPDLGAFLGAQ